MELVVSGGNRQESSKEAHRQCIMWYLAAPSIMRENNANGEGRCMCFSLSRRSSTKVHSVPALLYLVFLCDEA